MSELVAGDQWRMRRRKAMPSMTDRMMAVLRTLRSADDEHTPCIALPDVRRRTLTALFERDWIFASEGHDGTRYMITGRGRKALAVYEQGARRFDGICPTCGIRPRGVFTSGRRKPYCDECYRLHGRKQYALKGWQLQAETPCSRCHKRPRHVFPSGKRIAYCTHCRQLLRKGERKRKLKRKLWLIRIGRPPICLKCDQPVYHTANTVYDYCYAHYRHMQNEYNRKRTAEKRQAVHP